VFVIPGSPSRGGPPRGHVLQRFSTSHCVSNQLRTRTCGCHKEVYRNEQHPTGPDPEPQLRRDLGWSPHACATVPDRWRGHARGGRAHRPRHGPGRGRGIVRRGRLGHRSGTRGRRERSRGGRGGPRGNRRPAARHHRRLRRHPAGRPARLPAPGRRGALGHRERAGHAERRGYRSRAGRDRLDVPDHARRDRSDGDVGARLHRRRHRRRGHRLGRRPRQRAAHAGQDRQRAGPLLRGTGLHRERLPSLTDAVPRHLRPRHAHGRHHRRPRRQRLGRASSASRWPTPPGRATSPR
jgi:hypothetical protein